MMGSQTTRRDWFAHWRWVPEVTENGFTTVAKDARSHNQMPFSCSAFAALSGRNFEKKHR